MNGPIRKVVILFCFTLLAIGTDVQAVTITQWDFNSETPDANTATGTLNPIVNVNGSAAASLVGGTTATFASGDASGGSSDPATGDDSGWNVTTWPAASDPSETHGAQFLGSTAGFQDVSVSWDQRQSNSVSRFFAFHYTTDGSTWTKLNVDAMNANPGRTPAGGIRRATLASLMVAAPSRRSKAPSQAPATTGSMVEVLT